MDAMNGWARVCLTQPRLHPRQSRREEVTRKSTAILCYLVLRIQFTRQHQGCGTVDAHLLLLSDKKGAAFATLMCEATHCSPSPRLPIDLHLPPPSTLVLFDSPFSPTCQSWQTINQRSPPGYTHHPSCQPSTRSVVRTLDANPALTTAFPGLQLPVLYVVRPSLLSADVTLTTDRTTIQIVVYAVVIFAVWNIPAVRNLINPFKLFTIGWHELCHIIVVSVLLFGVYCQSPRSSTPLWHFRLF